MSKLKQAILVILDGWGEAPDSEFNAISRANTPNWDKLLSHANHVSLSASGTDVGLPPSQMGNSEVGHMHIGAGRVLKQELTRINESILDDSFANNPALLNALSYAKEQNSRIHIMGLLSPGGVHAHEQHIFKLIDILKKSFDGQCFIHPFLDGRDTPPRSALESIASLQSHCAKSRISIVSICGRYYSMDRDKRWERIEPAYKLLCNGSSEFVFADPLMAINAAYQRGENDEFVKPTRIGEYQGMQDGDVVIFMNFRADRARQISQVLTDASFKAFVRSTFPAIKLYTLTNYEKDLDATVLFEPQNLNNSLGEVIANLGLKQLRIAETEKYAHVTFFLNCGRETPFTGEDRILIPSPKVATYDLKPEMSAIELTDIVCSKLNEIDYSLVVINFANADMVGHTGNLQATIKAIECLDGCIGRIVDTAQKLGAELLITSDHGNAEAMYNHENGQAHTAHTENLVPCLHLGRKCTQSRTIGTLVNIAPTILTMLDIPIPSEMTAMPLFEFET